MRQARADRQRRTLLIALTALAVPRLAFAGPTRVALSEAFLLLGDYFKLASPERDRFYLAYRAMGKDKPAPDAKATYVGADGARTPVAFDAGGVVTNPPSLADLKSRARFETDGPPLAFDLEFCASLQPAQRLAVSDLAQALAQANKAVARFIGGASGVEPLTAAFFPDAGAGAALLASGQSTPLPEFEFKSLGKMPYIEPARPPAADAVSFERPPSRVILSRHPRKA
jgi:hypothetical protein